MKAALAQFAVLPGQPRKNAELMLDKIEEAKRMGADIIIFPELAVSGNLLGTICQERGFIDDCLYWGEKVIDASFGIGVVFGNLDSQGNSLLWACTEGKVAYRCGYEGYCVGDFAGGTRVSFSLGALPLLRQQADLHIHLGNTPYSLQGRERQRLFCASAAKSFAIPLVYVGATGLQNTGKNVYVLDGKSAFYNEQGEAVVMAAPFAEGTLLCEAALGRKGLTAGEERSTAALYEALVYAIKQFSQVCGVQRVVIGLSGGIDSTLAACLYTDALGSENVRGVNMPGPYTSATTKEIAQELAANLGIDYRVVPIDESVQWTQRQLADCFPDLQVGSSVLENVQARDRSTRVLAAVAAAWNGAFTCNGNKAEFSVGYATMYGDATGYFAALGDLWKHQVYELAQYINERTPGRIPQKALDIKPSAELSQQQAVEEGKGDPLHYPYHDYLLRSFVEQGADPGEILEWYCQGVLAQKIGCTQQELEFACPNGAALVADTEKWWRLYRGIAVAKRLQGPPVLTLTREAFLPVQWESQNGVYFTHKFKLLKAELTKQLEQESVN